MSRQVPAGKPVWDPVCVQVLVPPVGFGQSSACPGFPIIPVESLEELRMTVPLAVVGSPELRAYTPGARLL